MELALSSKGRKHNLYFATASHDILHMATCFAPQETNHRERDAHAYTLFCIFANA